ncbi:protein HIRA isoform X2 [Xenopus laevis]|uniref:Protein HIRA n=1 Tax=Xenopus laevis TaxID=8355 RepID=A0A8J0U916_XENLA|nr:protein HIRA isoform X2 [Xenopus laevis]
MTPRPLAPLVIEERVLLAPCFRRDIFDLCVPRASGLGGGAGAGWRDTERRLRGGEKPANRRGKSPRLNGQLELTHIPGHRGTMKLLKPSWVNHNGKPIFSVDIHPDGTKFATGGQGQDSGKVVIWNMPPMLKEEDEKNENIPKMLCQMDNHLACVNCVRWSNNGAYLASGGDDKLIMVWKRSGYIGPSTVFGSSSKLANVEQWRCLSILRSHSGDVMDVAWSPHDAWLASCSVDNTVVIWNALKFPEIISTLRGHSGLVKGLTWDPVGKYIASQADDHSIKVWRTMDWQLETSITKPFDECGGTTHVLRLSWSPDGHYLVSAHAMNNSGPTAQIIERDGWKTNMDFVGHRKAVTVVKFNPKIFKKKQKNGSSTKTSCPYCCCAVGSKDRSLSVWLTCLKRPLVVIHELFDKSIMDISWTLNGLGILVCSMDGSVAYLDFSQDELGDPLSEEEKNNIHQSTYGKSLAITTEPQLPNTVIENPEMLKFQQRQQLQQDGEHMVQAQMEAPIHNMASMMNGESLEDIRKNLLKKQVETRTADGRRRITPLCIAQLDTGGNVSSSSPVAPTSITAQPKIEPMKALDSRFTERSKATSGTAGVAHLNQTAVDRLKEQNVTKDSKPRVVESSSDSEEKIPASKQLSKRKGEADADLAEKRKKGRPRKESQRLMSVSLTVQSQVASTSEKELTCVTTSSLTLRLPTPTPQKSFTLQLSSDPSMYIEVENEVKTVGGNKLSQLKCHREGKEWEAVLTSRIVAAAGSKEVVCVACEKRMLSIFSGSGRRIFPPIILPSPISTLQCTGSYVMALTAAAALSVWDVQNQNIIIKNESLQPLLSGNDLTVSQTLLTKRGIPVLSLSNGKAYCFSPSLSTWSLVSDKQDSLAQCADYRSCMPSQDAVMCSGPLAIIQGRVSNAGRQAAHLFTMPHLVQKETTMAYLENQVAAALMLQSSQEYRHWLLIYAQYLVNEGFEQRLREVCQDLLGPVHRSSDSQWESRILGLWKRELLKELLPLIGQNLRFQRLFTEYQEQLDILRDK